MSYNTHQDTNTKVLEYTRINCPQPPTSVPCPLDCLDDQTTSQCPPLKQARPPQGRRNRSLNRTSLLSYRFRIQAQYPLSVASLFVNNFQFVFRCNDPPLLQSQEPCYVSLQTCLTLCFCWSTAQNQLRRTDIKVSKLFNRLIHCFTWT